MRRFGVEWKRPPEWDVDWLGNFNDRALILIWKFGSGWQNVVEFDYPQAKEREPVRICFSLQKTMNEAMKQAATWCSLYFERGALSYEDCYKLAARMWNRYEREEEFLCHSMHSYGNGYEWLDGSLVPHTGHIPEYEGDSIWHEHSPETSKRLWKEREELMFGDFRRYAEEHGIDLEKLKKDNLSSLIRKEIVAEQGNRVYPASEKYSRMFLVPDDVKDDWLRAAYRAAIIYKDNAKKYGVLGDNSEKAKTEHSSMGEGLVRKLEERFGERLKG